MKDDICAIKVDDTTSWPGEELLRIQRKYVMEFDNMVMKEVTHHFDCDLSGFKEWLNMKSRVKAGCGTNADRIRAMTDEELARFISCPENNDWRTICFKDDDCLTCKTKWLRQEPVDNGACSADETSEKVQDE